MTSERSEPLLGDTCASLSLSENPCKFITFRRKRCELLKSFLPLLLFLAYKHIFFQEIHCAFSGRLLVGRGLVDSSAGYE